MRCHNCGDSYEKVYSDLPFKIGPHTIIIIKDVPVLQCANCHEFHLEDVVMGKIDEILERIDERAEVEIFNYAA